MSASAARGRILETCRDAWHAYGESFGSRRERRWAAFQASTAARNVLLDGYDASRNSAWAARVAVGVEHPDQILVTRSLQTRALMEVLTR